MLIDSWEDEGGSIEDDDWDASGVREPRTPRPPGRSGGAAAKEEIEEESLEVVSV